MKTASKRVIQCTYDAFQRLCFALPLPAPLIFLLRGTLGRTLACVKRGIRCNNRGGSIGNFRRNIHRIEKGLTHQAPRDSFALTYIKETVDTYRRLAQCPEDREHYATTLAWAREVLSLYFTKVAQGTVRDRCKQLFDGVPRLENIPHTVVPAVAPFLAENRAPLTVKFEDFLKLATRRRSVRCFQNRPVEKELLEKALQAARLAPSACNRQPYRFEFFTVPETVQGLAAIPGGMQTFKDEIPCLCVLTVDYSNYFHERDLFVPAIDSGMAAMSFQFALETLGLSSVCVNWPILHSSDRDIRKVMDLQPWETPILFMAIGYSARGTMIAASCKKSIAELSRFDGEV